MKYFIDGTYDSDKLKETFSSNIWNISDPPLLSLKKSSEKGNGSLICEYNNNKNYITPSGDFTNGKKVLQLDPNAILTKSTANSEVTRCGRNGCRNIIISCEGHEVDNKKNKLSKKVDEYSTQCDLESNICERHNKRKSLWKILLSKK